MARIRFVTVCIAALTALSVAVPVAAEPAADSAPPVNVSARMDPYRSMGVRIGLSADRGRTALPGAVDVCADAETWRVRGDTKTRYTETTCTQAEGFSFDAVGWTAGLDDEFESHLIVERFERTGSTWRRVSVTQTRRSITANLRWVGTGEERTTHQLRQPSVGNCYSLVPCAHPPVVTIERERRAVVAGTLRFAGIGMTVRIPQGHGGKLHWIT